MEEGRRNTGRIDGLDAGQHYYDYRSWPKDVQRLVLRRAIAVEESIESMMDEIRGRLELLESNLPKHVDGWALSQKSKLPFKVLVYREALAWRMAELGRAAFEELSNLGIALAMFEISYNRIFDLMSDFIKLCDARVNAAAS
jgi:hypothetical protein